ncbi:MAG: hypothetical protein L0H84_05625 [Pseudonocardia sp.]|nr:hypothetical protein [Pseudonocardia sp.]
MRLPDYLLTHTVTVEPYLGASGHGPRYGPAVVLPAFVDQVRRTVRDSAGRVVTSDTTVYVQLDVPVAVTPEARVTVDGHVVEVAGVKRRDGAGLPTPDHIEISLRANQ